MTEQELRALVRAAIARHGGDIQRPATGPDPVAMFRQHLSHATFQVSTGADADGPCIIEPAVTCNHCGYCKSYGH